MFFYEIKLIPDAKQNETGDQFYLRLVVNDEVSVITLMTIAFN